MSLKTGAISADCMLTRPDRMPVRLSDFTGRPLVVIFLRHLA
jgi:hypothetical protein